MDGLDLLSPWHDPAIAEALGWYREVAANRKPAKFRIATSLPVEVNLDGASEDELWAELERLIPVFLERRRQIRDEGAPLGRGAAGPTLLDLCAELARRMLTHCNFCRWNCRVDRSQAGKLGACKLASATRVSTYFHHPGEELVYRGVNGSGTIFFTSCNMRCAFCQNGDISTDKDNGEVVDARTLATMARLLRLEGSHNVNWVGGEVTIHLHRIVEAIALLGRDFTPEQADLARPMRGDRAFWYQAQPGLGHYQGGFNTPMLWNSNFFMTDEAMRILRLITDVWLPDFKFGPGRCAMALAKTPWYWETVTRNLALIQAWNEDFTIRHLVMPNHVECCTFPVLEWIAEHLPGTPVNIMDQYHPDNFCDPASAKYRPQYAGIARRVSVRELRAAYRRAQDLDLAFQTLTFEDRGADRWPLALGM